MAAAARAQYTREVVDSGASSSELAAHAGEALVVLDTIHFGGNAGDGLLQLVRGEIAFVTSRLGLPTFAQHLVDRGVVLAHEIDLALALCQPDCADFVEVLASFELVTRDRLRTELAAHARAHLRALLAMSGLRVTWTRARVPSAGALTVALEDVLDEDDFERWGVVVVQTAGARIDERVPFFSVASVETARGAVVMTTENVSRGGAILRTALALPADARIAVRLMIGGKKLELPARVLRTRRASATVPAAIDVHWVDVPESTQLALARAIDALRAPRA